ncbi:MAG: patatin-like phospholipase family protein [Candidatus Amulumruptor sp.]
MPRLLLILLVFMSVLPLSAHQRVGLVLSGGGAKGIAHIGVIQALEDHEVTIDCIAGTSMGAIVGSLYAMGYSPSEMMALIKSPEFADWSQGRINQAYTYYMLEQQPSPALTHINLGFNDSINTTSILPTSLINPIPMSFGFMELFGPSTAQCRGDFDRLFVPFRCVYSDVYNKHKVVVSHGDLGDAVRASMSFPLVFKPIEIDGVLAYDGGIYDNFPVDVMRQDFKPDIMIGVDVSAPNAKPSPNDLMAQVEDMIMQKSDYNLPADEGIRIKLDLERFSLLDFQQADAIYDIGYRHAEAMIDSIMGRVTARTPSAVLKQRREKWRSATPPLVFDSVAVSGVTAPQARYVTRIFDNDADADTFGITQARAAFYRAVSPGRFSTLTPHADYDSISGLFRLRLDGTVKRSFDVAGGGFITSSTTSFLFLSGTYNNLTSHITTANVSAWLGQSYMAAYGSLSHGLSTPIPMNIGLQTAIMRQKFNEDEKLFYDWSSPAFITKSQFYANLYWSMAPTSRSKLSFSAGYGHQWDTFFSGLFDGEDDRGRDHTHLDLGQAAVEWERSYLDNILYPTDGSFAKVRFSGVIGNVDYDPFASTLPGASSLGDRDRMMSWLTLEAEGSKYWHLRRHFSLGLSGHAIASTRKLLNGYTASLVMAPAFTPTASSFNAYNPAFRANSWVAGGVNPVWHPTSNLQLRGTFNCFVPARKIIRDADNPYLPRYGRWFDSPQFYGEIQAVLTTPFAALTAYVNYQSYPGCNWNAGISLGLFHLAPSFL